jgi:DNA-binding transcriptional regulator PaaX
MDGCAVAWATAHGLDGPLQPWLHARVSESSSRSGAGEWVLLSYRLPREPSGPRTTLWRRLKRLGVAQLADGLVALPADARTRESLEWLADDVLVADGTAGLWVARPATAAQERELATSMASARAEEYRVLIDACAAAQAADPAERVRTLRRLRGEWRAINRRDFFPPPEREAASAALSELAARVAGDSATGAEVTGAAR